MYNKVHERYLLIGDFIAQDSELCISQFISEMNAKNIIKLFTRHKNPSNPSCIDLLVTDGSSNFQNTSTI